jgi:UDP-glucose 4-epimerase
METALVTGGAGFIGSYIVDELLKQNLKVIALDDLSGGFKENVNKKAVFIQGSITDTSLLEKLFQENKIDYIFHLAAYAAEGLSHFIRKFNYETNLIGSINLINLAVKNKIKCFVFTSSMAVYGTNQLPMEESLTPNPEDPYGISKLAVEKDLEAAHRLFGLDYIIFRPHNCIGPRQHIGDKYRNVVGIFMNQAMQKKPLTIFGDGEQKRAFSYIEDFAPIIAKSILNKKAYNEIFNIGSDQNCTINHVANLVAKEFNTSSIVHLETRYEVKHAYTSHKKLREYFGDYKETQLEQGIKKMADWAKKTGPKQGKEFTNIEIKEKLPSFWTKP